MTNLPQHPLLNLQRPVTCAFGGDLGLPDRLAPWPLPSASNNAQPDHSCPDLLTSLSRASAHGSWDFPEKPVIFISDLHADAESLLRSLVAARVIERSGKGLKEFKLTHFGQNAQVIIGGDCLDKGPSNLDLLTSLHALISAGADVVLLAGNHDLRLLLGLEALTVKRSSLNAHMFVRMGKKVLPLLKEVFERHVDGSDILASVPDEALCRDLLLPNKRWAKRFPKAAASFMHEAAIEKELRRLKKKMATFLKHAKELGLSAREVYAAALKCRALFVEPDGPYAWFFKDMRAVHQTGSLLFVHAGIDDHMARMVSFEGATRVNERFQTESRTDPFVFYTGTIANLVRTKYRAVDHPLTDKGVDDLHAAGIKLLVHGHVNRHRGQELKARHGLLHLEADITLDRHSRMAEGLDGIGTGATIISPDGNIYGISRDYPHAKVFNPAQVLASSEVRP